MDQVNAHKSGYKHTPLGWIPEEWEVKELGEIGKISSGTTPSRQRHEDYFLNGTIAWVKTTDLNNSIITETEEFITDKALQETSLKVYPPNTILVAMYGGFNQIGRTGILGREATINQALSAIQFFSEYYPKYVLDYLNHRVKYWKNFAGSSRKDPNITGKDVADFPIIVPSIPEQQKIATILSTWDEAIAQTQQVIAKLQQRNKGLMQELMTPKKHWKEYKLSELFTRVTRKNTTGVTNVVTISAQRGFVRQNDFFKKLVASDILDNYFLVRKGEFCYNKSYSNGYDWGATKRLNDFEEAVVTTLYICFAIINEQKTSSDFFEHFFNANLLDKGLSKVAHEGGRAHGLLNVTPADFFSLKIIVPEYLEQVAISEILKSAALELRKQENILSNLTYQKKGLMQKLMTGEVRVKFD